jgi:hypothetical protein
MAQLTGCAGRGSIRLPALPHFSASIVMAIGEYRQFRIRACHTITDVTAVRCGTRRAGYPIACKPE